MFSLRRCHLKFVKINLLCLILCSLASTAALAKEKLIFAVDLIRHGDRNPIIDLPKSPIAWPGGLGELTALGMRQEFELGVKLHKRYIEDEKLLPPQYQAENIYVRSTDMDRTLVSAESVLMGLYPLGTGPKISGTDKPGLPSAFQPIPIHTNEKKFDELLWVAPVGIFSKMKFAWEVRQSWREKTKGREQELKAWSESTGIKIDDFLQLDKVADNLYIRRIKHLPLPTGMTPEQELSLLQLGRWAFITAFNLPEMYYPMGHHFLNRVGEYFTEASKKKTPLKYVLFSAHDVSIMSVMNMLKSPLSDSPPYASDLNFSLYEEDGKYFVRVKLNDRPVKVPGCQDTRCTLKEFSRKW